MIQNKKYIVADFINFYMAMNHYCVYYINTYLYDPSLVEQVEFVEDVDNDLIE